MSRSGYVDDFDEDGHNPWRASVARAMNGKRGQAFLRELLDSLDALPEKILIAELLEDCDGSVCAIGAVGKARGTSMAAIDVEEPQEVAAAFGIARALTQEIEFVNDECGPYGQRGETPAERFQRVRKWVVQNIKTTTPTASDQSGSA